MGKLNKNWFLFLLLLFIVATATCIRYKHYVVEKDYVIASEIPCYPEKESGCFASECNDNSCSPEEKYYFYKIIKKKAYNIPSCYSAKCEELSCKKNELDCYIINCDEDTKSSHGGQCAHEVL